MSTSPTPLVRRVLPSHTLWQPHPYQQRAVEFLCGRGAAALFLDPGLGKTSITLEAFANLKQSSAASRMLVIAPLRVVQTVWRQEAQKWTQFRHLRFAVLHGSKKKEALRADADVYLINPEGVPWLANEFFGRPLPFDTVVIDELTKFKNSAGTRFRFLRPRLRHVKRRWGLTGTPAPNGYMDLFGQFLILDDGAALGPYITKYRDTYFTPDFTGFNYTLQPSGAARIEERIAPYVLRMAAEDYLDLPPLVEDRRYVELPPEAKKAYAALKKDMLVQLGGATITGANAAAIYMKLAQMANGAVYKSTDSPLIDAPRERYVEVHEAKLDAVEELVEELSGQPLLLAYQFNHDLERLLKRFPGTPYLGAGVGEKRTKEIVDEWNAGRCRFLLAHPASAGHGLNLQGSGASHVGWLGPIWDLELYEQFIQRVHRQGNTSGRVVNHVIVAKGTIDELVVDALAGKATTQNKLLSALNAEVLGQDPAAGSAAAEEMETSMQPMRLSRQTPPASGGAPAAQGQAAPAARITPKGWGAPANGGGADVVHNAVQVQTQPARVMQNAHHAAGVIEQERKIEDRLTQAAASEQAQYEEGPAPVNGRAAFSPAVQAQMAGESQPETANAEPVRRTRTPKAKAEEATPQQPLDTQLLRQWALRMAMEFLQLGGEGDIFEIANLFIDYVEKKE